MTQLQVRIGSFAVGLALVAGCYGSTGVTPDGGSRDADGGVAARDGRVDPADGGARILRSCDEAFAVGQRGDRCEGFSTCTQGGGGPCSCPRVLQCYAGVLDEPPVACPGCIQFDSCETFLSAGAPVGAPCNPTTFGTCFRDTGSCCGTSYRCEASGEVVGADFCGDCLPPPPFCEGYMPPPPSVTPCRAQSDCANGRLCVAPGESIGCGACRVPERQCETDLQCQTSPEGRRVCVEEEISCSCTGGRSSHCEVACTALDGTCPAGELCDGASGRCRPRLCTQGFMCPSSAACTPGAAGADANGCVRRACAADTDCDCGACVLGVCRDGPGFCSYPPA